MNIPSDVILRFHTLRTQCHVDCVNYFADLLGYHFPEHDNDKQSGVGRDGYAYINWASYHPDAHITRPQYELYKLAHDEHHKHQPHHLEHYADVAGIPHVRLIEMICDWHSANFEQKFIIPKPHVFNSVMDFYNAKMCNMKWTDEQREFIINTTKFLAEKCNHSDIVQIWQRLTNFG